MKVSTTRCADADRRALSTTQYPEDTVERLHELQDLRKAKRHGR